MTLTIALIIGVGGQDGSYLAEFLLNKQYEVHGIVRQSSVDNTHRIAHLRDNTRFHVHIWDLSQSITPLLVLANPTEVYNLAAMSFVGNSFTLCRSVLDINTLCVTTLLQDVKTFNPLVKLYQASSSEMFGSCLPPQSERSHFAPNSPYAVSKLASFWLVKAFREAYGVFFCNGILFNHESPRRALHFVTKKICNGVAKIRANQLQHIELGNIYAKRDWGHAKDYVRAMWMIMQHDAPDDFVVGTGVSRSVKEFVETAFDYAQLPIRWQGTGPDEIGIDQEGNTRVKINKHLYRLTEVDHLEADPTKSEELLGWRPEISFADLVKDMMDCELKQAHRDCELKQAHRKI